jgi:hypothetical protein
MLMEAETASVVGQVAVHGADSLFVAPTVRIAWAVRKGASEDAATVVVRIVNSAGAYGSVRLDGIDPFSKSHKVLAPVRPLTGQVDLAVPRTEFAEFPSCEIHLYQSGAASDDQAPYLTVYYLGVPDTTPEFSTGQAMDAYLEKILAVGK